MNTDFADNLSNANLTTLSGESWTMGSSHFGQKASAV